MDQFGIFNSLGHGNSGLLWDREKNPKPKIGRHFGRMNTATQTFLIPNLVNNFLGQKQVGKNVVKNLCSYSFYAFLILEKMVFIKRNTLEEEGEGNWFIAKPQIQIALRSALRQMKLVFQVE